MQDIQNIGQANSEIVRNCEVFDIKFYFLKVVLMYLLCILEDKSNHTIQQQDLGLFLMMGQILYNKWTNHLAGFYCNFILVLYYNLFLYLGVL